MRGAFGLNRSTLAIGIAVLTVVGIAAVAGGYELRSRAPRTGPLTAAKVAATESPTAGSSASHSPTLASPSPTPASLSPNPASPSPNPPTPNSQVSPSAAPSVAATGAPITANGIAFDAATGQLIAFGSPSTSPNSWPSPASWPVPDTWIWDGSHWNKAATVGPFPPTRTGASMAYDPVRKVVVMHGGWNSNQSWTNDTWAWNGTQWTQLSPASSPPADAWVREQPLCWDGGKGAVLMVNEQGNPSGTSNPSQTWGWDGTTWTQLAAPGAPALGISTNQWMAMAYDPARKVTVMFSEVSGMPTTWAFDGASWRQVATSGSVSASFVMAADDGHANLVLFGSAGDTWTWDGSRWLARNPAHAPAGGGFYAMAYDPVRHVIVLLEQVGFADQTWTWNGFDWTQVA